jgi:hypothetical protein
MMGEVYGGNITKTICKVFGGWGIPYKDISFLTFFGDGLYETAKETSELVQIFKGIEYFLRKKA